MASFADPQTDERSVLAGQIAVVTGAARGIGEAISYRLARMGAEVVLVARDGNRLKTVQKTIQEDGGAATPYELDLRSPQAVERFGQQLRDRWKRCDVLVNNAGTGSFGKPLHEMTPDQWDETMETNLRGPFLLLRAVAPLMIGRKSGHVINISSLAGHNPVANGAAYAASKWGLNGLTYSAAEELRPHGVRVSVVAPGSVNTGFGGGEAGEDERAKRKIQPGDVADVVAMLVRQEPQSFVSEVLMRPTAKS